MFAFMSVLSLFARSDGHALRNAYDGYVRVGFPLTMYSHGGFVPRAKFDLIAVIANLLISFIFSLLCRPLLQFGNRLRKIIICRARHLLFMMKQK